MTEPNAFIIGRIIIPWSAILIVFAILAWFFFAYSFAGEEKKERIAYLCMLPFSIVLSFFFCRLLYWYSNQSQYQGLGDALKSTSLTAFSLLGILPGIAISATIIRLTKLSKNLPGMLDVFAAPTAFMSGLFYLTGFFSNSCRGKFAVTDPVFTRFPFAVISTDALGNEQYRFATFFAGFVLMCLVSLLTFLFYIKHAKKKGATLAFFLLFYSAVQFILESTRYDAGYFPFNGFVSIIQIASAASIVGATIVYSITSIRKTGMRAVYPVLWVALLLCIGATGYLEYLVQRHGDMAGRIYPGMALSCLGMALIPAIVYFSSKPQTEITDPNK